GVFARQAGAKLAFDHGRCAMRITLSFIAAVSLLLGACVHEPELRPATAASRIEGDDRAAFAETQGVYATVRTDAWKGDPSDLNDRVTPLEVTIENRGDRRIRIIYSYFGLNSELD